MITTNTNKVKTKVKTFFQIDSPWSITQYFFGQFRHPKRNVTQNGSDPKNHGCSVSENGSRNKTNGWPTPMETRHPTSQHLFQKPEVQAEMHSGPMAFATNRLLVARPTSKLPLPGRRVCHLDLVRAHWADQLIQQLKHLLVHNVLVDDLHLVAHELLLKPFKNTFKKSALSLKSYQWLVNIIF